MAILLNTQGQIGREVNPRPYFRIAFLLRAAINPAPIVKRGRGKPAPLLGFRSLAICLRVVERGEGVDHRLSERVAAGY